MSDVEVAVSEGETRRGVIPFPQGEWKEVVFLDREGAAFTEGDIRLGETEEVTRRRANAPRLIAKGMGRLDPRFLWPKGQIPFQIDPLLPNPQRVLEAIAQWEQYTPLRFIQRTGANATRYGDYLLFCDRGGCWSYVGMQGYEQPLSLSPDAHRGNAIHEIGHAVGLWHEQSRTDRDEFIEILFDNIMPGMQDQFRQQLQDGKDLGGYDYESVMHYPRLAFSRNGQDTIRPRQERAIGQREGLSPGDIASVKMLYSSLVASK